MIPVLTPSEMAAADAAATTPVATLIERAGAAVAREALQLLGGGYGRRVVVLAGKGNNGADGRVAARRLQRRGVRVEVIEALDAPDRLPPADLVIDAAYGTGFHGSYDAPESSSEAVLAVDIPSGVSGTTGEVTGRVLGAMRTVTFAALKPGLVLGAGRELSGEVVVADIGLEVSSAAGVVEQGDVAGWLRPRRADGHKWDASVLVIAGSPGMVGAANLAAAAAQRTGAGMVRLGIPGASDHERMPVEAVGVRLPAEGWEGAIDGVDRLAALVVGPGLGRLPATEQSVRALLGQADVPAVVDADALLALASRLGPDARRRPADTVLTPHDGEFARLMGQPPGADRLGAARQLAARSESVVLLKGRPTIVAHPSGAVRLVSTGDARLATAGTGDVLSGIIGALLARGLAAFDAAAAGAWLHGLAGQRGPADGLVASDLIDLIPGALAAVRT